MYVKCPLRFSPQRTPTSPRSFPMQRTQPSPLDLELTKSDIIFVMNSKTPKDDGAGVACMNALEAPYVPHIKTDAL